MKTITYNKLVRDKIPQIIEDSGKKAVFEKVDGDAYEGLLFEKLGEEFREFMESQSVEELADMVEIIYAIVTYKNISIEDFESIRQCKVNERGAFINKLLLEEVIED